MVITSVLRVKNPCSKTGKVNTRDIPQRLRNRIASVLYIGLIHCRSHLQFIGTFDDIQTRLRKIIHHHTRTNRGFVHSLEYLNSPHSLWVFFDAGHQSVIVEVVNRCYGNAGNGQCSRKSFSEVDTRQDIFPLRIQIAHDSTQPALSADIYRFAGMPDVHSPKMRPARVWISDALHNRHITLLKHLLQGHRIGVPGQSVIHRQNFILAKSHNGPTIVVYAVGIRDNGIHEVIAALQFNNDEDRISISHFIPPFRALRKLILSRSDNELQHLYHAISTLLRSVISG